MSSLAATMPRRRSTTLHDIAQQAGVTTAAVSYVLNDTPGRRISPKTRQQIKAIAEELNYVPHKMARSLATGRSRTLAACFSGFFDIALHDPYAMGLIRGILRQASAQDYALQIITEENRQSAHGGVDGWIGILSHEPLPQDLSPGTHLVYLDPDRAFGPHSYWADNRAAGNLLAETVQEHSRQALLLHHGPIRSEPHSYQDRGNAFLDTYRQVHGARSVRRAHLNPVASTPVQQAKFRELLRQRIEEGTDTIICVSDILARLVQSLLLQEGFHTPEDVNLVGFDNTAHSEFAVPPISTVDLGVEEMGRMISQCLIDLIEGRAPAYRPPSPRWIPRLTCRFS